MATVAARELRNHTADVLRRVTEGEHITVTVRGVPVAQIVPPAPHARPYLTPAEVLAIPQTDPGLRADLALLGEETTDDLGPIL